MINQSAVADRPTPERHEHQKYNEYRNPSILELHNQPINLSRPLSNTTTFNTLRELPDATLNATSHVLQAIAAFVRASGLVDGIAGPSTSGADDAACGVCYAADCVTELA